MKKMVELRKFLLDEKANERAQALGPIALSFLDWRKIFFLGWRQFNPIAEATGDRWRCSNKQQTVSMSSREAEHRALSTNAAELVQIQQLCISSNKDPLIN